MIERMERIIPALVERAAAVLERYEHLETQVGDGHYGVREAAPFDAIAVIAAANHVPPPWSRSSSRAGAW
jgi:protein-L-isoaspartate(D-aspartate) O-methyltransferase